MTKTVIQTALDEELTEHLGYESHDAAAKVTANSRNGTRPIRRSSGCGRTD
ncbi:transposase [Arthrobacter sp. MA-N2]|uniref:transposase n=1 Tax=Arthrobacter sp. MA-N2 TaxID=1101188 RepID=UPI0004BB3C94